MNRTEAWTALYVDAVGIGMSSRSLTPKDAAALTRLRHVELHQALDELLADWIRHVRTARPSTATVLELMQWSHQ